MRTSWPLRNFRIYSFLQWTKLFPCLYLLPILARFEQLPHAVSANTQQPHRSDWLSTCELISKDRGKVLCQEQSSEFWWPYWRLQWLWSLEIHQRACSFEKLEKCLKSTRIRWHWAPAEMTGIGKEDTSKRPFSQNCGIHQVPFDPPLLLLLPTINAPLK